MLSCFVMKKVDICALYSILRREVASYRATAIDEIAMQTDDPFKALVSTMLSARTKDETTSAAAERLFSRVKTLADLEDMAVGEIEGLIYPVGFYKTKASHLKSLPGSIREEFNNRIPDSVDELVRLPGVGRKTANLVVAAAFKKPAICVDTHVHRIMNRLGYVKTKTPLQTEMMLRKKLPRNYWITINSLLVSFGQNICRPISPHCSSCPISRHCNRIGVRRSR